MQASDIQMRHVQTNVGISRFVRILGKEPSDPFLIDIILSDHPGRESRRSEMCECSDIQTNILIGGQWPDFINCGFKFGGCVCAHLFPDPTQSSICMI